MYFLSLTSVKLEKIMKTFKKSSTQLLVLKKKFLPAQLLHLRFFTTITVVWTPHLFGNLEYTQDNWKNQNPMGLFEATYLASLDRFPGKLARWQCCLAGSSRILIYSIAMGGKCSFEVRSIETYAPPNFVT